MTLYSIGHSNAEIDAFIDLLKLHDIEKLVDTRSQPFSRYSPHFNREALQRALIGANVEYIFMGDLIGGRPDGEEHYFADGKPDYDRMAEAPAYLSGIDQLIELGAQARVAFMCSEADFKKCHRYKLITRTLVNRGLEVNHILHSGDPVSSSRSEFEPAQMSLY
jgi:uncharacterized protein (DUF488 family)